MNNDEKYFENWDEMSVYVSDKKALKKTPIYLEFSLGGENTMTVHLSKANVRYLRDILKKALRYLD